MSEMNEAACTVRIDGYPPTDLWCVQGAAIIMDWFNCAWLPMTPMRGRVGEEVKGEIFRCTRRVT
jgi:hypothetical protein